MLNQHQHSCQNDLAISPLHAAPLAHACGYMRLLAEAIREPDEIRAEWVYVASGVVLKRTYIKRYVFEDAKPVFLRFEWTSKG